ncbi:MAG: hypothetical protein AB8G23_19065 [Myxococcota bacterium]
MTASVSESAVSFEAVTEDADKTIRLRLVVAEDHLPPNAELVSAWLSKRGQVDHSSSEVARHA